VEAKAIIPEKWFEFSNLKNYRSGPNSLLTWLTLARNDLDSVQPADLYDDDVLYKKSGRFYCSFIAFNQLRDLKITDTSKENLADKRHEKHVRSVSKMPPPVSQDPSVKVGPIPPPETEEETRIASISNPERSSAGSKFYHACREWETHKFATLFCEFAITAVFRQNPSLNWVTGRPQSPQLEWRGG
jgi:hypothetical protein